MPDDDSPSGPGPDDAGGPTDTGSGPGSSDPGSGPPVLSRQDLQRQAHGTRHRWSRARWYTVTAVAILAVAGLAVVLLAQDRKEAAAKSPAPTTTTVPAPVALCPLTGAPAPGGTVPARPALGVKIGNYTGDRPSAGLNQADIVFEEPVEGAITRLVAVFQCKGASLVGDLRSAREPDAGILSQLSNPLFAHAGGISPVLSLLASSPLIDKNLLVIQQSVTTWQAYNRWGGYSLYYGNRNGELSYVHAPTDSTFEDRARIVSFDRPYDHDWASGAADLVGNEFPVIFHAERLGLDVTYWTDVDLHARPQLLGNHRALLSLGHDEYWSTPMRDGAAQALARGVNLAFLGANACYRQIRFEPSPLGANRHQVCYKSAAEDPMTGQNDALVTVNWPEAPVSRPEAQLIGSTYQDVQASADMIVADPSSWALQGTGLVADQILPKAVEGEFDRYVPGGAGPANLDVIAHSVVPNRDHNYSDVTWYTVAGGGGVFATGNASWIGQLSDSPLVPPNVLPSAVPGVTAPLLRIMENVYSVLGTGPASATHPSHGNWSTIYSAGSASIAAPNPTNSA